MLRPEYFVVSSSMLTNHHLASTPAQQSTTRGLQETSRCGSRCGLPCCVFVSVFQASYLPGGISKMHKFSGVSKRYIYGLNVSAAISRRPIVQRSTHLPKLRHRIRKSSTGNPEIKLIRAEITTRDACLSKIKI